MVSCLFKNVNEKSKISFYKIPHFDIKAEYCVQKSSRMETHPKIQKSDIF